MIEQRCAEDEWQVLVQAREVAELEDGTTPPEGTPDEDIYYPLCYRDSSEIKLRPAAHQVRRAGPSSSVSSVSSSRPSS